MFPGRTFPCPPKVDPGEDFWTEEEIAEELRLYGKDEANEALEKLFQVLFLFNNLKPSICFALNNIPVKAAVVRGPEGQNTID